MSQVAVRQPETAKGGRYLTYGVMSGLVAFGIGTFLRRVGVLTAFKAGGQPQVA